MTQRTTEAIRALEPPLTWPSAEQKPPGRPAGPTTS